MEFAGLQNTKEGGIVWRLHKASSQEKPLPSPPVHESFFEMMKDHERRVLETTPTDPPVTQKADDTWTKKLRKVAKTLIKIKNEKPSSFNEEVISNYPDRRQQRGVPDFLQQRAKVRLGIGRLPGKDLAIRDSGTGSDWLNEETADQCRVRRSLQKTHGRVCSWTLLLHRRQTQTRAAHHELHEQLRVQLRRLLKYSFFSQST